MTDVLRKVEDGGQAYSHNRETSFGNVPVKIGSKEDCANR